MVLISSVSVMFCAINTIKAQIITKNIKCFFMFCVVCSTKHHPIKVNGSLQKILTFLQGSHSSWKTWKNDNSFSSPGKVLEFYNFIKKILEKWEWTWKNELSGKNSFKLIVATWQLGLACSWIPRREIKPHLLVAPSVFSEACPHCIYNWLTLPGEKGGLA